LRCYRLLLVVAFVVVTFTLLIWTLVGLRLFYVYVVVVALLLLVVVVVVVGYIGCCYVYVWLLLRLVWLPLLYGCPVGCCCCVVLFVVVVVVVVLLLLLLRFVVWFTRLRLVVVLLLLLLRCCWLLLLLLFWLLFTLLFCWLLFYVCCCVCCCCTFGWLLLLFTFVRLLLDVVVVVRWSVVDCCFVVDFVVYVVGCVVVVCLVPTRFVTFLRLHTFGSRLLRLLLFAAAALLLVCCPFHLFCYPIPGPQLFVLPTTHALPTHFLDARRSLPRDLLFSHRLPRVTLHFYTVRCVGHYGWLARADSSVYYILFPFPFPVLTTCLHTFQQFLNCLTYAVVLVPRLLDC